MWLELAVTIALPSIHPLSPPCLSSSFTFAVLVMFPFFSLPCKKMYIQQYDWHAAAMHHKSNNLSVISTITIWLVNNIVFYYLCNSKIQMLLSGMQIDWWVHLILGSHRGGLETSNSSLIDFRSAKWGCQVEQPCRLLFLLLHDRYITYPWMRIRLQCHINIELSLNVQQHIALHHGIVGLTLGSGNSWEGWDILMSSSGDEWREDASGEGLVVILGWE